MISDVLSDGVDQIDQYQRTRPKTYASFATEIRVVVSIMDSLRIVFDVPCGFNDEHGKLLEDLRAEIKALEGSGVMTARNRLMAWVERERSILRSARLQQFGYDPEAVLARAVAAWTQGGEREQPSNAFSNVDTEKHEVHLRNVNGLLATYKIGPGGELRRTPDGKEGA